MGRPASDKKIRLIGAAAELFHRRGLSSTSLADVAHHAAIQPGNVYYHFRSKGDLVAAVAEQWVERVDALLADLERDPDPWARLAGFIARADEHRADYAAAGCPIAGINRDLRLGGGEQAAAAVPAFERQLAWLARQFVAGRLSESDAEAGARFMLASIQGSFLLGHALADERLIGDVAALLGDWLAATRRAAA